MNIVKNQIDTLNATLKVEIVKEDYADRVKNTLKSYQKNADIKGFRQGKAPMGMVQKMYGQAILVDEVNKLIGESLHTYIRENELQILGEPLPNEAEQNEIDFNSENFEFVYDIALTPEVNIKLDKKTSVPFYTITIDEEMLAKQLDQMCQSGGEMRDVEDIEGTEYIKGELIELDEKGAIKENGIKNEDASMSLNYMKDEDSLTAFKGKKIGEEVKFNAAKSYPNEADFAAMLGITKENAASVGENFCFIVKEVKRFAPAELNEELFVKVYGEEVKDVETFKTRVKEDMAKQMVGHSTYRFTVDARDMLIKKNANLELPEAFLKRWIVATNDNMTAEQIDQDFDKYRDGFKWELVRAALVKEKDIKVEREDLIQEARNVAAAQLQQYGLTNLSDEQLDGFAMRLLEDEKQQRDLYERSLDTRIFNVIKESIKLKEQEISMADFEKLFQN